MVMVKVEYSMKIWSRNPIDPYGVAKAACERDIEIANEQHGLDYCIIRPHNVYRC
jgi:nucleoside-diphosphate-sugar epimerase